MPDSAHTLLITTKVSDLASQPLKQIGQAGEQAGKSITQSMTVATRSVEMAGGRFDKAGQGLQRAFGGEAKRALTSVALGISSVATASDGAISKVVSLGANMAASFATGGLAGLAISALSIGIGKFISGLNDADEAAKKLKEQLAGLEKQMTDRKMSVQLEVKGMDQQIKAAQTGIPLGQIQFFDTLKKEIADTKKEMTDLEEVTRKLQDDVAQRAASPEAQRKEVIRQEMNNGLMVKWGMASAQPKEVDPDTAVIESNLKRLKDLQEIIASKEEEGPKFYLRNAAEITREAEKQLHLAEAKTEQERLQVEFAHRMKEVREQTNSNEEAMQHVIDEFNAKAAKNAIENGKKRAFVEDMGQATTPRLKIEAEYRRDRDNAEGNFVKLMQAEIDKLNKISELNKGINADLAAKGKEMQEQRDKELKAAADLKKVEEEKAKVAADYVRNVKEQTSVINDQTGKIAEQIKRYHELEQAKITAGEAGVKAVMERFAAEDAAIKRTADAAKAASDQKIADTKREAAAVAEAARLEADRQKEAERIGSQGKMVGGYMDKGLATARGRRRQATHERKYRAGAFHNNFDIEGNELNDGQIPFPQGADFNQAGSGSRRGPIRPSWSPSEPSGDKRTHGSMVDDIWNGTGLGAPGAGGDIAGPAGKIADAAGGSAKAAGDAATAMNGAATAAAAEKASLDAVAAASTNVKNALTDNATAQAANLTAVQGLAAAVDGAWVKNTNDMKKLTDDLKKLTNDLKAAGLIR